MYVIAALAFIFYVSKVPERYFPGEIQMIDVNLPVALQCGEFRIIDKITINISYTSITKPPRNYLIWWIHEWVSDCCGALQGNSTTWAPATSCGTCCCCSCSTGGTSRRPSSWPTDTASRVPTPLSTHSAWSSEWRHTGRHAVTSPLLQWHNTTIRLSLVFSPVFFFHVFQLQNLLWGVFPFCSLSVFED